MTVTIDATRLKAKIEAAQRAAFPAQRAFLHGMAAKVATTIGDVAPKDTRRYVASVLDGFRQAGVDGPLPPALTVSGFRGIQRAQLNRQVEVIYTKLLSTRRGITYFTRALDKSGYTSRGRPLDVQGHTWKNRLLSLKALEKAYAKLHVAAIEQLARFNDNKFAIVFGVGRGAIHKAIAGDQQNQASRVLPILDEIDRNGRVRLGQVFVKNGRESFRGAVLIVTVRKGVNGGEGVTAVSGGDPVVVVRSKEPHARILEGQRGIVRKVLNDVRPDGLKQLKRALVVEIAKKSGLVAGAA